MSKTIDAGITTAYGAAVRGGYEGTYDQFCEDLAKLADVLSEFLGFSVTVETLAAGTPATGDYDAGVLSLGIPQGETGNGIQSIVLNADYTLTVTYTNGQTWTSESIRGETGATPRLTIGTVQTLEPGQGATAEITGTPEDPVLNLGIPRGQAGASDAGAVTYNPETAYNDGTVGKAVSDLTRQISDAVAGVMTNSASLWHVGSIRQSDGGEIGTANRIRLNGFLPKTATGFSCAEGYGAWLYAWSGETYIGVYNNNGTFDTTTAVKTLSDFDLTAYPEYSFRVVLVANAGSGTITVDDYGKITVTEKRLSTNDFTNADKEYLHNVEEFATFRTAYDLGIPAGYGSITTNSMAINRSLSKNRAIFGCIKVSTGSVVHIVDGSVALTGVACYLYDKAGTYVKTLGNIINNKADITIDMDGYAIIYVGTGLSDVSDSLEAIAKQVELKSISPYGFEIFDNYPIVFEYGAFTNGVPSGDAQNRLRSTEYYFAGKGTILFNPDIVHAYYSIVEYEPHTFTYVGVPVNGRRNAVYTFDHDTCFKLLMAENTGNNFASTDAIHIWLNQIPQNLSTPTIADLNEDMIPFVQNMTAHRASAFNDTYSPFGILHLSDVHNNSTVWKRMVEYLNTYRAYLTIGLHTGDYCGDNSTEYTDLYALATNVKPILNCVGNHDTYVSAQDRSAVPVSEVYTKLFNTISSWGVVTPTGVDTPTYYYKDFSGTNVRLVVLDNYYAQEAQATWLADVLSDAKTNGLHVITASHECTHPLTQTYDTTFQTLVDYNSISTDVYDSAFDQIIADFKTGGGIHVAHLCGHRHHDCFGKTANGVLNIVVECALPWTGWTDSLRVAGTKSYDCFNVFGVDANTGAFKIARIGANSDCYCRDKVSLAYDYINGQLLYTN